MNWGKVSIAALVGGAVIWIADFVQHGVILGNTYMKYDQVFSQEAANPAWFLLISICIAFVAAVLFAKTRACWAVGAAGGLTFGFWVGLIGFFPHFYSPLVIDGFPYYLAWCQGGATLISALLLGVVLGLLNKG